MLPRPTMSAGPSSTAPPSRRRRRRVGKPKGKAGPGSTRPASTRPRARRTGRWRAVVWGSTALGAVLAVAALVLYAGYGRSRPSDDGSVVEIDWPAGASPEQAAALLAERGLVGSAETMAIFLRATGGTEGFVPGPHLLGRGASPWELRRLLARTSDRPTAKVVVPEGYNRFDIAARLHKLRVAGRDAFLRASADGVLLDELGVEHAGAVGAESAEGYMFPATYELPLDSDARDIVRRLVAEADKRWQALAAQHKAGLASLAAPPLGFGRREILTVASMIEKEAMVDDERPLVASVFYNRLVDADFKPKRLQSDPTSAYGCLVAPGEIPSCAGFAGKPTPAINHDAKNRYSTYVIDGLPPGPIANPGAKSIEAAIAPATTRYFYFVAAGNGRHTFSETLGAHNDAVRRGPRASTQ